MSQRKHQGDNPKPITSKVFKPVLDNKKKPTSRANKSPEKQASTPLYQSERSQKIQPKEYKPLLQKNSVAKTKPSASNGAGVTVGTFNRKSKVEESIYKSNHSKLNDEPEFNKLQNMIVDVNIFTPQFSQTEHDNDKVQTKSNTGDVTESSN